MANSEGSDVVSLVPETETPLLFLDTVHGAVDYKGRQAVRSKSGYWRSAWFIIGIPILNHLIYREYLTFHFSIFFLFILFYGRRGSRRKMCLLWNTVEPDNLFNGAASPEHGRRC